MRTMICRLISILLLVLILSSCGESKKTTITGTVNNTARQLDLYMLDLNYMPEDDISYINTKRDADGIFEFNVETKEPAIFYFVLGSGNVKRKFNSEIKKLLTKNYESSYSLKTRRSGSFFLPVYPGMKSDLNIDFGAKKQRNDITYNSAQLDITGDYATLIKAFWETEEEVSEIQFAEYLSVKGDRSQPKEMPAKEALSIIDDLANAYIKKIEQKEALDDFLKTYFINEITYKAKNVLIQYFNYVSYNKINGLYLGTSKFNEYESLFTNVEIQNPHNSRQFCIYIELYMTHLMNKEFSSFESYFELDEKKYEIAKNNLPESIKIDYLISRINHIKRVNNKMYNKLLSRYQQDFTNTQN